MNSATPHSRTLRHYWLLCAAATVVFVLGALLRSGQIMGQDELSHYYKLIGLLFHQGYTDPAVLITFSPHLYPLSAWVFCAALGSFTPFVLRLCGILYWLSCLALLAWLCRPRQGQSTDDLSASPLWRALPLILLACMPVCVQAAVIIEIDQSALPLFTLLLCCAVRAYAEKPHWRRAALIALALAAALWCRLSTPLLLLPLFIAYGLLLRWPWRHLAGLALACAAGWTLFHLSWRLYGQISGVNASGVFDYLRQSFGETTVGARANSRVQHSVLTAVYLAFWGLNPYLLLALAWAAWQLLRQLWRQRRLQAEDLFLLAGLWLLAGYSIVAGALFGFPKYHCPALPLLALGLAINGGKALPQQAPKTRKEAISLLLLAGAVFLLALLVMGDPLLLLRCDLRLAKAALLPLRPVLSELAWRVAAGYGGSALILAALWHWRRPAALLPALIACALGMNAALAYRQSLASYATGYIYGDRGATLAVAELIKQRDWSAQELIVPIEVRQGLPWAPEHYTAPQNWGEGAAMAQRILRDKPALIAVSPLINPTSQLRMLSDDPALRSALADYEPSRSMDGHFWLWQRRQQDKQRTE
jgi:hypothetical protein